MRPFVIHIITGLNNGGAEGVLFRLVTNSRKYSHIVISLMDEGVYGERLRSEGIPVYSLGMRKSLTAVLVLPKLYKLIKKLKPDCVQTWMYHGDLIGGVAAKLARVQIINWNIRHSNLNKDHTSRSTLILAKLCACLSKRLPDRIIVCAKKAYHAHSELGYCTQKMVVIPNGYDLREFFPGHANTNRPQSGDIAFKLGMVGRFNPDKDHANLISAFESTDNNELELDLVGPCVDEDNDELVLLIPRGARSRISLLGATDNVPDFLRSIDAHVLSSSSEGFPNVVAEAMACGTPCVVTDVGDAAEIVGDTGWVVPPKNPEALAKAINEAYQEKLNSPDKWEQRREGAVKRILDNYSLEKMVKAYECLWANGIRDK